MSMRRPISPGLFLAVCDEDIVVLDARRDLYSCLPEAALFVTVTPDHLEGPDDVMAELAAAGIVGRVEVPRRKALPPLPTTVLLTGDRPACFSDDVSVLLGMVAAWTRGPGQRPLYDLLARSRRLAERDPVLISRLTSAFVRRLPWDPRQGACLYRAWLLRRILEARGQNVDWVFGVRTWPFGAHCWLQIADQVLDDDPDRVAQYTPIMVV